MEINCLRYLGARRLGSIHSMSNRNDPIERAERHRLRLERERNRGELQLMNVLREHAQRDRVNRAEAIVPMANANNNNNNERNYAIRTVRLHQPESPTVNPRSTKRKCTAYSTEDVESWATTEIEQETFSFLWSIKAFSSFSGAEEVKSPLFRGGVKSQHSWQLKMNPRKKADEVDYFSVHLILNGFGDGDVNSGRKLKVRFQISLLDQDGRPGKQAGSQAMNVCDFKRMSVWGYDKFMALTDLMSSSRRLLEDDVLKIHCRVWIEGDLKHISGEGGSKKKITEDELKSKRSEQLTKDFRGVLDRQTFVDVALSTNTNTFMAHKVVLCARSQVFERMLTSSMLESAHSTVEISDFDEDVVKGMLDYMYTGETDLMSDKAADLMQIAEKYDIVGLKEDCEHAIASQLNVEDAAEILVLAHLYNATVLKPQVVDFINRNKEEVKKTRKFQEVAQANAAVFVDLYLSQ